MIERNSLIIIQTAKGLQASLCRVGFRTCDMLYTQEFVGDCATQDNIESTLSKLKNTLKALRLPDPQDIRLCLNAKHALFREWSFPFRSRNKIKQSLALLLDAEFPFEADTLEHRVYYAKTPMQSKHSPLITISSASSALQIWFDAFDAVATDWYPSLVTFDPFPLLYALPKNDGMQLVLHTQADHTTVSLVENGCVRRIRVIAQGLEKATPEANNGSARPDMKALLRDIAVVLDGAITKPTQLILFGDCYLQTPLRTALAEALDLPVVLLGQDIPYANNTIQTGELSPERSLGRLAALALARMPSWVWHLQSRCPSFHRQQRRQSIVLERYKKYIAPACAVALVVFAYLVATWAEGHALHTQAAYYETKMRETFQKAAPDARNIASMRQMRSILSSKIQAGETVYNEQASYFTLTALNNIHKAIPNTFNVRINKISFDKNRCQLSGVAKSYEQVESIRQELAKLDNVETINILRATAQMITGATTTQRNTQNAKTTPKGQSSIAPEGQSSIAPEGQSSIVFDMIIVFTPKGV